MSQKLLLKLDDYYYGEREEIWAPLLAGLKSRNIVPTIGVIAGRSASNYRRGMRTGSWLFQAGDAFELFNHGVIHTDTEFHAAEDKQVAALVRCQEVCEALTGIAPPMFGAPSNAYTSATLAACERVGFSGVFCFADHVQLASENHRLKTIDIGVRFSGETNRHNSEVEHLDRFVDLVERRVKINLDAVAADAPVVVYQVHPSRWSEPGLQVFFSSLDRLVRPAFEMTTQGELLA